MGPEHRAADQAQEPASRLWYAEATLEHGWRRPVLAHQIGTRLKERQGQAVTNFARTLRTSAGILIECQKVGGVAALMMTQSSVLMFR